MASKLEPQSNEITPQWGMTLPNEAEVILDIAIKYRPELDAMTSLHDAVVSILSANSWTVRMRGLNLAVVRTAAGLLTKACKTFRSIQLLCERGLIEDADVLTRVLMETSVAIAFILQKRSRERAAIYHAYSLAQDVKMLNEWKRTPGLKRKVPKHVMKEANEALATWIVGLPAGTDFRRHWSGRAGFQEAVRALRGDAAYSTLYRFASSMAHASDVAAHFEVDDATGDLCHQLRGRARGFEAPSYAARELLWHSAATINKRFGLTFSPLLEQHKVKKQG